MFVTPEQIFDATDGGLTIILDIYPQAAPCLSNAKKKFKIRANEKSASASIKKLPEGIWVVTDFGGDQKVRNAIEIVRLEQKLDFKEAIQWLASKYNIIPLEQQQDVFKADFSTREATPEEVDGVYTCSVKEDFTEAELKELFAEKIIDLYKWNYKDDWQKELQKKCIELNFRSLNSYSWTKDRKHFTIASNENYPVFLIEGNGFKKYYQPKNKEKQYRFSYSGTRPKDYIFGYDRFVKKYNEKVSAWETAKVDAVTSGATVSKDSPKLESVIICSGDRDSLNCFALGYDVIWQNSETAVLSEKTSKALEGMAEAIYNLPDIDTTGKRQGHELAMRFLHIRTIWLPESLREKKDFRGNPCKDFRDYMRYHTKKEFGNLVKSALAYQFWDKEQQFTRDGKFKKMGYAPNNAKIYNFLMNNGFWRFKSQNEKEGYIYIQIQNNTVAQRRPYEFRTYLNNFLKDRQADVELRNAFYRTTQLGDTSLSNLGEIEIDFTDYNKTSQYMFFINKTWKISKDGIEEFRPDDVAKFVWDNELIKHRVDKLEAPFTITAGKNATGEIEYDIKINNDQDLFLRYLVNTSRVHWKKEFEDSWPPDQEAARLEYIKNNQFNIAGSRLTAEEIKEQKLHLVNKLYSLGYLLHRYKDPSRPWCVFAMDAKVSDAGESHGGSGKSIAYKAVRYFMTHDTLNGRNPKLTDNPHIYEKITEHTDFVLIDDASQYLNFDFFFAPLTGDLDVNPKNNKQYSIPFEHVPKFTITSNYTLSKIDPSTERRILYTVFGDYYHFNSHNEYRESRSPKEDFGKNLFQDFTEAEWNYFINTMAYACSFYMNCDKVEPPMNNVEKRNLQTAMGAGFENWAEVYFSNENMHLDQFVIRDHAFNDFKENTGSKLWTSQRWLKSLVAWCQYKKYELNPKEYHNASGRILRKRTYEVRGKDGQVSEKEKTFEMVFIKTLQNIPTGVNVDPSDIVRGKNQELEF